MHRIKCTTLNWVLILSKYKLVYVPIPKVACTKIRTLLILLNRGYEDLELYEFLQNTPAPFYHWEFGINDNHHVTPLELSNVLNNSNNLKFAFVRNPYKRIESIYYYRINNPYSNINLYPEQYSIYLQKYSENFVKKIKADLTWDSPDFIKSVFARIEGQIKQIFRPELGCSILVRETKKFPLQKLETYNYELIAKTMQDNFQKVYGKEIADSIYEYLYLKLKKSFGYPNLQDINLQQAPISFVEFINYIFNQDVKTMDVHWMPQTLQLGSDFIEYDFIGRIEKFEQDATYLLNQVQAPQYIYQYVKGKMNKSKKAAYSSLWTEDLAEKVYQKYQSDFEEFGYEKMSYKE